MKEEYRIVKCDHCTEYGEYARNEINTVRSGEYEVMGQTYWVEYPPTLYIYEVTCKHCNKNTQLKEKWYA